MSRDVVFEILTRNFVFFNENLQDIDATLVPEASNYISEQLANILYDSVRENSSKRINLLKFVRDSTSFDHEHHNINSENYHIVLNYLESNHEDPGISELFRKSRSEVWSKKQSLFSKVLQNERKKFDIQRKLHFSTEFRLNFLRKKIEKLGISCVVPQQNPVYEPKEIAIKRIFGSKDEHLELENNHNQEVDLCLEDRLKQIRFGYALYNIANHEEISKHIEIIMLKLKHYKDLFNFEKSFLRYSFYKLDKFETFLKYFYDDFFFILEVEIIELCRQVIISYDNEEVIENFLGGIPQDKIVNIIKSDQLLLSRAKNLLWILYFKSYCNGKLLKLLEEVCR